MPERLSDNLSAATFARELLYIGYIYAATASAARMNILRNARARPLYIMRSVRAPAGRLLHGKVTGGYNDLASRIRENLWGIWGFFFCRASVIFSGGMGG